MPVVRLFIWNAAESQTAIDELRDFVPELDPPSAWIWNEASERFGVIVYGDELPEAIGWAQDLVGSEPDVFEEFDAL